MEQGTKINKGQTSSEQVKHWVELISTIVMSIATIATGWSSYQAAKWGGEMSVYFNQAGANRTESVRSSLVGGQKAAFDVMLFNEWLKAINQEDDDLAEFYLDRMGGLRPVVEAWIATEPLINPDAPLSPFVMEEYAISEYEEAKQLEAQASELFEQGTAANQQSDDYIANAVILASVLFFAGVSSHFKRDFSKIFMLVMGCALLVYGLYNISNFPIA